MTNEELLTEAIRLSVANVHAGGGPFGAVVARNGEIIAASGNRVTATNDPTAHAEIAAIRMACEKLGTFTLSGCELFSPCEPCPMCLGAVYWARLDALHFAATRTDAAEAGFDDAFLYGEIERGVEERAIPTRHAHDLRGEANAAFAIWRVQLSRTPY
ncbi:MAG: nucleoside deaminase [Armatimonadetes bacterium]|nr:nucleoside deaminase [Armatimonadota bacterium]